VHYYFDTWIQMLIKSCVNYYFSLSFLRKKTLKKYMNMFLACQQSKVTIKLNFYYSNLKKCRGNCQNCRRQLLRSTAICNAIAVDWFQGNSRPDVMIVFCCALMNYAHAVFMQIGKEMKSVSNFPWSWQTCTMILTNTVGTNRRVR
jgi:hypothetical protein